MAVEEHEEAPPRREEPTRRAPWIARTLALIALGLAVAAVLIVVAASAHHSAGTTGPVASATSGHRGYWRVRPGQTLSYIASRERTSLAQIEALNPHVDSAGLRAGQRVRVR